MRAGQRLACFAVALSTTTSGAAVAKRALVLSRPPHVRPPPDAPTGRDVSAGVAIDVRRLPELDPPQSLSRAAVRELSGTAPTELKVETTRSGRRETTSITVDSPRPASVFVGERASAGSMFSAASTSIFCEPREPRAPIRWETFAIRADGGADWTVSDGFVDQARCEVKQVSRRRFDVPRLVGLGVPVHAARVPGGVLVFSPHAEQVTGDTTAGALTVVRAPVNRVFIPTQQGESASVLLEVSLGRLDAWLRSAGADALREAPLRVTLALDVSQAVSEAAPTLFVRSKMTMAERPPTPPRASR